MTQERYVELARQLQAQIERLDAIRARAESLEPATDPTVFAQRLMLSRLVYNTGNQLKALTVNFGHSEAAMEFLRTKLTADQVEFISDQVADELAYKHAHGGHATDAGMIMASALEIEEMLPILRTMVDRCGKLLVDQL